MIMYVKGLALSPDQGHPVDGHCCNGQGSGAGLDPVKTVM